MADRFLRTFDNPAALLVVIVAALVTTGLVMVYSASGARAGLENLRAQARVESRADEEYRFHHGMDYFVRQAFWVTAGLVIGAGLVRVPVDQLERLAPYILAGCLVLLLAVILTPLGVEAKGARRWLGLGPFTIQPSEFAKVGLVVYMARFLATRREQMKSLVHGFLPAAGIVAAFSLLIVLQRDLGTIVLMGGVMAGMWVIGQVRVLHLASIVLAALPVLAVLILSEGYRQARMLAFLDPEKYALTHAFQLNQSLIAVGSGGLFGTGLGAGLQKYHFLSESHTDFIFAILCEETGMIGAGAIVLLYVAFMLVGFRISYRATDYFSGLVAAGLTMVVGCAAFMNFYVVLGMAPTKGLALPYISYGGSSMLASMACAALLVAISNDAIARRGGKEAF